MERYQRNSLLDYVVEVVSTIDTREATEKLQRGWVLLGVFGTESVTYSLGRVPKDMITVKKDRLLIGISHSN